MRVLRAATGQHEMLSCFNDFHGKTYGAVSLAQIRSHVYGRVRAPGLRTWCRGPTPTARCGPRPDGTIDTDKYIAFYDEYIDRGDRRRRGRLRAGADPGLGRLGHAAGRLLPQAAQVLRRAQDPAHGRRGAHQHGPHRQVARAWSTGTSCPTWSRSARASATASRSRAWPCASRTRRAFEKISRLQQLRRQPDGLRRGAGLASR